MTRQPYESGLWPFRFFPVMILGRWPRLVLQSAFGPQEPKPAFGPAEPKETFGPREPKQAFAPLFFQRQRRVFITAWGNAPGS